MYQLFEATTALTHKTSVALLVASLATAMAMLVLTGERTLAEEVQLTEQVSLKPHSPVAVTAGSSATATVNFGKPFASISSLCFDFQFVENLLDPGETLIVEFAPTVFGGGFTNIDPVPLSSRTFCVVQPEVIASFLKGQHRLTITMAPGSVTIENLTVRVIGIR